jgi:hypothetical protein
MVGARQHAQQLDEPRLRSLRAGQAAVAQRRPRIGLDVPPLDVSTPR